MTRLLVALHDGDSRFVLVPRPENDSEPRSIARQELHAEWTHGLTDGERYSYYSEPALVCTANDLNAAAVMSRWPRESLIFEDKLAETVFMRCYAVSMSLNEVARLHAAWETSHTVPSAHVEVNPDLPLTAYQRAGVAMSRMCPGYGYFLEQGCGKTAMVVSRLCTDVVLAKNQSEMRRALVVCPKDLRLNWESEFKRFSTVPGKVTIMRGRDIKRLRLLTEAMRQDNGERFTVVILSYGLLVQVWDSVLKHIPWHLAVLDEAHMIKSPGSQRFKVCRELRDHSEERLVLTGTPITNSVMDLYALFEFMDRGLSGYSSFTAYKKKFGIYEKGGDGNRDVLVQVQNKPVLKKRLAQVSFIVRKDQVLRDLPEKRYDVLEVEMSKRQAEDYDKMARQLAIEIENDIARAEAGDGRQRNLVMNNALAKMMKLAQITSGFLMIGEERDEEGNVVFERETVFYDENPKLNALVKKLLELRANEKAVVWSCWKVEIAMIAARLAQEGIECVQLHGTMPSDARAESLRRYNCDPTCRVLVANPAVGGVGANLMGYDWHNSPPKLDTNTTLMVHTANSWKPVERWQADDRSHRRGTRVPVQITDLCVPDTIDEDIRLRVLQKRKDALDMQDLREILCKLAKGRSDYDD